jgi:hypothetical protein
MPTDPIRLLDFCRALENATDGDLAMLDREEILAVHRSLTLLKEEIEQLLVHLPLECKALN